MGASQQQKPAWAGQDLRLDPYALPQKVQQRFLQTTAQPASSSSRKEVGAAALEFTLDRGGAVMKGNLPSGLALSLALPSRAFSGVAARAFENEDGSTTVTLELLHSDPALCVPLCVSSTVEDAASDWHSWARRFGLPMLLVDEACEAHVVKDYAGLTSHAVKPRRLRTSSLRHRPQFLRRRRMGMVGPVVRLEPNEIIARN